jgi:hypothetical protein
MRGGRWDGPVVLVVLAGQARPVVLVVLAGQARPVGPVVLVGTVLNDE